MGPDIDRPDEQELAAYADTSEQLERAQEHVRVLREKLRQPTARLLAYSGASHEHEFSHGGTLFQVKVRRGYHALDRAHLLELCTRYCALVHAGADADERSALAVAQSGWLWDNRRPVRTRYVARSVAGGRRYARRRRRAPRTQPAGTTVEQPGTTAELGGDQDDRLHPAGVYTPP